MLELLSIKEASKWASDYLKKNVSPSNISYLIQYGKICKPLFTMLSWWKRYSKDTVNRLKEFDILRTDTFQVCLQGDSRNIDIISKLKKTSRIGKTCRDTKN